MIFDVVRSDIINIKADAIVLSANEHLKEGGMASHAIFEAAGRKALTKACDKIGYCATGSAVPTCAFNLNARYIIHAVAPHWVDGKSNEYNLLSSAYLSALNVADIIGCESIAFPLLSSGYNKFDKELAVKIATESIHSFCGVNLKKAYLVVYGDALEKYMQKLGYPIGVIPDQLKPKKFPKIMDEGKKTLQRILEDEAEKAIEWLKDEENRRRIFDVAVTIVKKVLVK